MNKQLIIEIENPVQRTATEKTAEESRPGRLEVNVIFSDPLATAAALKTAKFFAQDLGACIRVQVPIVVSSALPLDKPQVSLDFMKKLLSSLISRLELEASEVSAHLYLCRDRTEALLGTLTPKSLVIIGDRKSWWHTAERRLAKALRAQGHRVVLINVKTKTEPVQ